MRSPIGIPRKRKVTQRWNSNLEALQIGATANQTYARTLKANQLIALTTNDLHEPLLYNQLSAVYDQYVVTNARIRVDYFLNEAAAAEASGQIDSILLGITPMDDTTTLTTPGHYCEMANSIWTTVSPEGHGRMTHSVDVPGFFGIPKKQVLSEDTLRCIGVATPQNALFFHIWAHRLNPGVVDVVDIELSVTIEFDVTWMEPKAVAQS